MSFKSVLPLLSLFLLGACSSSAGNDPAIGEQASTVSQADESGGDGD